MKVLETGSVLDLPLEQQKELAKRSNRTFEQWREDSIRIIEARRRRAARPYRLLTEEEKLKRTAEILCHPERAVNRSFGFAKTPEDVIKHLEVKEIQYDP